jgi:hypothetical protein
MEIRQQRIDEAKLKSGMDEDIRLPVHDAAFHGADAGGANCDAAARGPNRHHRFGCHGYAFRMQLHFLDVLCVNRLKCAEADVQRYLRDGGSGRAAGVEDLWREVETGRRRGN